VRRRRFLDFLHSQDDNEQARQLSHELAHVEPRYDQLTDALEQAFDTFAGARMSTCWRCAKACMTLPAVCSAIPMP
jgi:hypothetical protein